MGTLPNYVLFLWLVNYNMLRTTVLKHLSNGLISSIFRDAMFPTTILFVDKKTKVGGKKKLLSECLHFFCRSRTRTKNVTQMSLSLAIVTLLQQNAFDCFKKLCLNIYFHERPANTYENKRLQIVFSNQTFTNF